MRSPERDRPARRSYILTPPRKGSRIRTIRTAATRRSLELTLLGCLPVALVAIFVAGGPSATYAWDFHAFWGAAAHLVHGQSPYADLGADPAGKAYPQYLYPPLLAELILPLGALPFMAAAAIFVAASAAALVCALLLLGVRDWRCYGAAFLWAPVLHGLRLGALTPFLVLGVAACWRLRDRRAGEPLAALVATLKLFLWPLLVLAAATRGLAAAARLTALTALLTIGGWAAVGFAGLGAYPSLLRRTQNGWESDGYGMAALARRAGLSPGLTGAFLLVGAAAALAVVIALLRRKRLAERAAFSAAVVLACVFSPVTWLHYSALLLVPVALLQPSLGPAWFAPLFLWVTPFEEAHGHLWRIGLWLLVAAGTPYLASRPPAREARPAPPQGRVGLTTA